MASPAPQYIFGGDTGHTPESIRRTRELAQLIMGRTPAPRNVGEGFAALANGFVANIHNRRADEAEQAGLSGASDIRSDLQSRLANMVTGGASVDFSPSASPALSAANAVGQSAPTASSFSGSQQEFIDMLMPAAMEVSRETGIDARIILAQAAQETGWGRSAPGNNFFGIKSHGQAGGQTLNTHEYVNGERVEIADNFRAFESPADSVYGYRDFILSNPRYGDFLSAQGLDAQLEALGASGYATDPTYAQSVGSIARGISMPPAHPQQVASLDDGGISIPGVTAVAPQVSALPTAQASPAPGERPQTGGQGVQSGNLADIPIDVLLQAVSNPFMDEGTRAFANTLLSQQMERQFPQMTANQSDFLYAQQYPEFAGFLGQGGEAEPNFINVETPDGIRTYNLADPAQLQEVDTLFSTGQGRQVGVGAGDSARESQIARLLETGMDRNTAIGIVDGRLRADRHPVTGELQVVDMATGQPVYGGPNVPSQAPAPNQPGALDGAFGAIDQATDPNLNAIMNGNTPNSPFGPQYPAANQSFGLEGAATGVVNTIGDAIGVGAPYPNVQQTQADFGVLRESLLNDIASAYNRQPPSWLLQEIRNLTPTAGSPFEGTGTAVSKLNAIGRHLANELELSTQALGRALSPQNRQEVEARVQGLQAGIARVQSAIQAFGTDEDEGVSGEPDIDGWVTLPNGVRVREVQ